MKLLIISDSGDEQPNCEIVVTELQLIQEKLNHLLTQQSKQRGWASEVFKLKHKIEILTTKSNHSCNL